MDQRIGRAAAGWAGTASAVAAAGAGELAAALVAPQSSPIAAIGSALIDLAPSWAKDLVIAVFGTSDKLALLALIGLVLIALGAAAGLLQRTRPPWGAVLAGLLGAVGILAAVTREHPDPLAALPSLLAGAVGAVCVHGFVRRPRATEGTAAVSRRGFVIASVSAAALGAAAVVASTVGRAADRSIQAIRQSLRLPAARTVAEVPASAEIGIPGLAPVITPNREFYRIDTALIVPEVDPAEWELRIRGLVEREVVITWDELLALPLEESVTTLSCVSNQVGGDLVGTALWLGYPIRHLLARAGVKPEADMVLSRSRGGFTAGTPLEALTDGRNAILAVGMNGEPLPREHGFPVRMVVPGLYGYVSATKWVTSLEVTRFDRATAYWTDRGWSARGPIKLQSRIDVPRQSGIPAGRTVVAGVAWQPHVGVEAVEVRVDGGPWQPAELASAISDDTWVQWTLTVELSPGEHELTCRARSASGELQTGEIAPPAPDGATGWHTIRVTAA